MSAFSGRPGLGTGLKSIANERVFRAPLRQIQDIVLPEAPMSRPQTNPGVPPTYNDTSNDGKRRFIPFVLSFTGRLGPYPAVLFAELYKEARKRGHDFTAMGPTNADAAAVASLRADASWANRNFPA